ncbi:tripartite tricarboxylate transporter substrate binding protein [Polynucleobacter kasalickyi]|uniref:Tripartite-type tricarboxylate transporter, receptor component TctC n=1 Tax=Polynucleobacter kasalickyi TaxID=1938817 RepID=A0A1W1Z5J2_9BURK|nr:tripartite tricarboxylate transporter substrate binding protein [Polynucleobacter kasalickyi]SMC43695.1 Tripartite-type tricarboxylate transporter, receptor component TctC [Polynucleobacter kasalickyi]
MLQNFTSHRRLTFFFLLQCTSLLFVASAPAEEPPWPSRTVKIIGPAAGSGADLTVRIVAKYLSKLWQQPVIVENKPGAGGSIGTAFVAKSEPDGYTLLIQSASYAANPSIYKKLPYDPGKNFIDIDILGMTPYALVTNAEYPIKTVKDLEAMAKVKQSSMAFASAGVGSSTHLAAEYFNQTIGVKLLHVPYKGSPDAIADVMAGRSTFYMAPVDAAMGMIKSGRLRVLGMTSKNRLEIMPEIPTIAEQGYPNFEINLWVGLWAPTGTPAPIIEKINRDVGLAMQDAEVKDSFQKAGIQSRHMTLDQVKQFVKADIVKYQKIAASAGIEPQ